MKISMIAIKERAVVLRDCRTFFSQAIVFGTLLIYAAVTLPNLSSLVAEIDATDSKLNFDRDIGHRSLSVSKSLTIFMDKQQHHLERDEFSLATSQSQLDDERKPLDGPKHDGLKIVWLMSFPNSG
jgi:hypothetical protein